MQWRIAHLPFPGFPRAVPLPGADSSCRRRVFMEVDGRCPPHVKHPHAPVRQLWRGAFHSTCPLLTPADVHAGARHHVCRPSPWDCRAGTAGAADVLHIFCRVQVRTHCRFAPRPGIQGGGKAIAPSRRRFAISDTLHPRHHLCTFVANARAWDASGHPHYPDNGSRARVLRAAMTPCR